MANDKTLMNWRDLWYHSPLSAYVKSRKHGLTSLTNRWFESHSFIGFVDGAWSKKKDGIIEAGIGGFLMDHKNHVSFIFSGPFIAQSPYDRGGCIVTHGKRYPQN